jgi:DNA repair protein RecO (recombination protein O)
MLQEMGYAVPLEQDEHETPIKAEHSYAYVAERGACSPSSGQNGLQLSGKTLLDMAQDNYTDAQTQQQSKQLMRTLLAHYLGDKPLYTRQLLIDLQGL